MTNEPGAGGPSLAAELVDTLVRSGDLRSDPWKAAVLAVPRQEFLPRFYLQEGPYNRWRPVSREELGEAEWLRLVHQNVSWVTQVEWEPWRPDVVVDGFPTSSSTLPGLVVRMLEELDVADGMRVLEIGTGTGYSTALLSDRLGSRQVVSVEYDPSVSDAARMALHRLGYRPELVVGDGAAGYAEGAPYDRIVATCSFTRVPYAWIEQAAPGAVILTAFRGGLDASAFVRLTVDDDGVARGRFYPGGISFMISRRETVDRRVMFVPPGADELTRRVVSFEPDLLDDWVTFRFLLQCRVPPLLQTLTPPAGHRDGDQWWNPATGAGVGWYTENGVTHFVEFGGSSLWPAIEGAYRDWVALGRPGMEEFELTVTQHAQTFQVPGTDVQWCLPKPPAADEPSVS